MVIADHKGDNNCIKEQAQYITCLSKVQVLMKVLLM